LAQARKKVLMQSSIATKQIYIDKELCEITGSSVRGTRAVCARNSRLTSSKIIRRGE